MKHLRLMRLAAMMLCITIATAFAQTSADDSTIALQVSPEEIEIGVLYRGAEVKVEAEIPAYEQAVLLLQEDGEEVMLNRKGREAGIWLNVAQVTVKNAPKVYLLAASEGLDEICSADAQRALGLGVESLKSRMNITSDQDLIGNEADEFIKLKKDNGTYRTDIGIRLNPNDRGSQTLSAALPLPATVPPGIYHLRLYCFRDGRLMQRGAAQLSIKRVGLAEFMASLAQKRAALYGVMAILIAMIFGIGMGVIFHSLPGSGH